MARQLKKISISFTLSCLLLELGHGSTPCQNGYDYNNRCDPYYNVNLIQAKVSNDRNRVDRRVLAKKEDETKALHKIAIKANGVQRQSDLSYLDSLRRKYSNQFDGNIGLQALIDRSKYLSLKKIDKEDKSKVKKDSIKTTTKVVKSKQESKIKSKHIAKKDTTTKTKERTSKYTSTKEKISTTQKSKIKIAKSKVSESKKTKQKVVKKSINRKNSKFYTVKKGDSLIKIAKKFSLKKDTILSLNKLDKNATIKIGQKLILPLKTENKIAKVNKKTKQLKNALKQYDKGIYTVQNGDTLSSIAKKKNISLIKLRELNRLSRSSKIKVGEKLILTAGKAKKQKTKSYNFVKNIKFKKAPSLKYKRKIRVVATAYTSHRGQTDKTPFLAAWNNRIRPGMKIIAVSPDLIRKYGLTNGVKVKILGLPGYYVVRDKMNARLRNHIDIYMGVNKRRALRWGRRRIVLYW